MAKITCSSCHKTYPPEQIPFRCECGGAYDYAEFPQFSPVVDQSSRGILRYAHLLDLNEQEEFISLGEGNTPLLPATIRDKTIFLKMESMNPTGSYKDRGTCVLVSFLKSKGVIFAVEDSSGNAGASFAAYCARAGIKARVYVPESASGPKRKQIEMYGAELVCVPGPRSEAAREVLKAAHSGLVYASHGWMPFGLTGIATIAYEIVEQLGQTPGTVVAPIGHGGLLYGIMRGFKSMAGSGFIDNEPYYFGVQADGCAPIAQAFERKSSEIEKMEAAETVAEGVKVTHPVRGRVILENLLTGKGRVISCNETSLLDSWRRSASQGFYIEPTSALVWAAMEMNLVNLQPPVVAVITGSGYKSAIHQ